MTQTREELEAICTALKVEKASLEADISLIKSQLADETRSHDENWKLRALDALGLKKVAWFRTEARLIQATSDLRTCRRLENATMVDASTAWKQLRQAVYLTRKVDEYYDLGRRHPYPPECRCPVCQMHAFLRERETDTEKTL